MHDELLIEAPEEEAKEVSVLLEENMEQAVSLKVPMVAEVKTAKSWFDAK